ncbi:MAG: O-antigen ligase family protein [Pseudomonadota bacterium]
MHAKACPPRTFSVMPLWLWQLGGVSLMMYGALRILWPTVGSPAETITALLGLFSLLFYGRQLRSSAPMWLLGAALLVQLLSWTLGYFHHPEWVADNPRLDRLGKLFIFIAVAWWLAGSTQRTLQLWALALIGFVIGTFVLGDGLAEWQSGLSGQRIGFGIRNFQHGSMLFGVVFLALIIFSPRLFSAGPWRALRAMTCSLLIMVSLLGVLIGQTRAVWLALSLALPITLMLWLYHASPGVQSARGRKGALLGLCLVIIAAVGFLMLFYQPLMERVTAEKEVMAQLLSGEVGNIPYTSIGIRINTWFAAAEWIQQRPVVGWGGEARSLVIEHTPWLPTFVKAHYGHLHNFLLEVWVAYGLLGVGVIATLALWIGLRTWQAWRAGVMPGDIALFGASFFVYWMVVNQFEAYNAFWTGVFVHNLVVGGLVTHIWRWQYAAVPTATEDNECAR